MGNLARLGISSFNYESRLNHERTRQTLHHKSQKLSKLYESAKYLETLRELVINYVIQVFYYQFIRQIM